MREKQVTLLTFYNFQIMEGKLEVKKKSPHKEANFEIPGVLCSTRILKKSRRTRAEDLEPVVGRAR